ncbi:phospholipase D-like domain-containing protein [Mycobacterium sp. 1423905.2]|uniref:phospholipase D-like domain-containing protein n=1 Tax=Mycobacterium sp. 1423905.2 TaxID=1856859 RepID=UPI000801F567|nr:phospholipase D-like domain-containing protein [Mycobacterium sp. 1423905.2]OBJ53027.1 hypothetical protein A9W95_19165 [Mycobacterium sp. 1423905.2]
MRFKSDAQRGIQLYAVAGTNVVSFGIRATETARKGLLGFAIRRKDLDTNESYWAQGYKVFKSLKLAPTPQTKVLTVYHPIQSLTWDDFYVQPGKKYEYEFYPFKGTPKEPDLKTPPAVIQVSTEKHGVGKHDIFFNRGVTGSQSYAINFQNIAPDDQPTPDRKAEAYNWLGRGLDDALTEFISSASDGDAIRGCFYEFSYGRILDAFKEAIDRGVDVKLIVDEKENATNTPRDANLAAISKAQLPRSAIIPRVKRPNDLQHNKFIVLLRGKRRRPAEVWTGSTNLTTGGIFGQANVGHVVRDANTARTFLAYWELLATDPGGLGSGVKDPANLEFLTAVEQLTPTPKSLKDVALGITPIFSPRNNLEPLDLYLSMLTDAKSLACGTFAFGIARSWRKPLNDSGENRLRFLLLDKDDNPKPLKGEQTVIKLDWRDNIYEAHGSELGTPLGSWVETNNKKLGLNKWVNYVHLKFLLSDPLGPTPIVVTGSANFSSASTKENDENMILIKGDRRVADIYFTEFNRLWGHYYYRSVVEKTQRQKTVQTRSSGQDNQFLSETPEGWLSKYAPDTLRTKRLNRYLTMSV